MRKTVSYKISKNTFKSLLEIKAKSEIKNFSTIVRNIVLAYITQDICANIELKSSEIEKHNDTNYKLYLSEMHLEDLDYIANCLNRKRAELVNMILIDYIKRGGADA